MPFTFIEINKLDRIHYMSFFPPKKRNERFFHLT